MTNDRLFLYPNQFIEKRPTGCVGITLADILGNIHGMPMDPDFSLAAGFAVQGMVPTTLGQTAIGGMYGAVAYGCLGEVLDRSDPIQTSQFIESDFANYTYIQKSTAALFAPKGIRWLNSYDDIARYLLETRWGAAVGFKWYSSFGNPRPDGVLRTPDYENEPFTYHETACYENTSQGLRLKSWQGPDYGDHGDVYMPRSIFEECWTGAAGFDPKGWRWASLVGACLQYPRNIPNLLPLLIESARVKLV